MKGVPTVFVVDDDNEARDSVCALVRSMNLEVRSYASAEEFLQGATAEDRGCLVVDVRMTGMSGIELVKRLHNARRYLKIDNLLLLGDRQPSKGFVRQ